MDSENYIKVRHLQEAILFITNQNETLRKNISQNNFEIDSLANDFETQKDREENLKQEIQEINNISEKIKKLEFEIKKTNEEKAFHIEQHQETKKKLYLKQNNDFQINSFKKELAFKKIEAENLKTKIENMKNQIEELFLFSEKPTEEINGSTEFFYAKKIAALEEKVQKLKKENSELELKNLIKKKDLGENKIEVSKILLQENETLKQKLIEEKQANFSLKQEFEKVKNESLNQKNEQNQNSKLPQIVENYLKEIEKLKQENFKLNNSQKTQKLGDLGHFDLMQKLTNLGVEKRVLQQKADELENIFEMKNAELESMRSDGPDSDALQNLIDANKRLSAEIFRLQEQLRQIESFSRDSIMNSFGR